MTKSLSTSELIDRAEMLVGGSLYDDLVEPLRLARDVTDLAGDLIEAVQDRLGEPKAFHACAILLSRLLTDLRAVTHLVRIGYAAPALSLTAGMLEMAYTAMYIGADEDRATAWLSHSDFKKASPWSTYDTISAVASSMGDDGTIAKRE